MSNKAARRVVCDVCGKENDGTISKRREKCLGCPKMFCRRCVLSTVCCSGYCPDCSERRLLEFVEKHDHRTSRDQIAIPYQGHVIYGVPRIGPNV